MGFSAIKEGGYIPALPAGFSDEISSNVNPNFHLVLKKMNKKDGTTKLKVKFCYIFTLCLYKNYISVIYLLTKLGKY